MESLKETLQRQQKLLHQLYAELEAEREASSSAASEALSMILRLQEEKAACQLEACQFKRMTEEKMKHAHEIQVLFEEVMHKKEMEIASLEFQLKAYHYKLLSLGITQDHDTPCPWPLSRIHSLPTLPHTEITVEELSPSKADDEHDFYFQTNSLPKTCSSDLTSHWQQIKELDQRVNGLSRIEYSNPIPSIGVAFPPDELHIDLLDSPFHLQENDPPTTSTSTSQLKDIHDVFEVPQNNISYSPHKRLGKKLAQEEDHPFPLKCCCRDQSVSLPLREGATHNNHFTLFGLTNQFDFQHLNQRLENLENQTTPINQEILRLFKEIHQKLDVIQLEITSTKLTNHPPAAAAAAAADHPSLVSLMEAMFFYSL